MNKHVQYNAYFIQSKLAKTYGPKMSHIQIYTPLSFPQIQNEATTTKI